MNILLGIAPARPHRAGLPSRHRHDGRDVHVRQPCARGRATSPARFRARADARLTGGSPRYQLYPTRDGKLVGLRERWSRNSGTTFTAAIGLAAEFIDDRRDPAATTAAVAAIVAGRKRGGMAAGVWPRPIAASPSWRRWRRRCAIRISSAADCSRTRLPGASGATMPALPVPIAPAFRARHKTRPLPVLGAHNKLATTPRRASAAAAKRKARPPRARRRGATGRSGRSGRGQGLARPAPAGNPTAACG